MGIKIITEKKITFPEGKGKGVWIYKATVRDKVVVEIDSISRELGHPTIEEIKSYINFLTEVLEAMK